MQNKELAIKLALEEFEDAVVVESEDGRFELICSSCGLTYFTEEDFMGKGFVNDFKVTVLQDACPTNGLKVPSLECDGKTTFILVRK